LFQHVRYHEADILEFERVSAQHWTAILGDGERVPRAITHPPKTKGDPRPSDTAKPELKYISAKEIVEATGLPAHLFTDRVERERKRIPHLLLVRNLRFSLDALAVRSTTKSYCETIFALPEIQHWINDAKREQKD
jgi:hypothetical protein